ncbi:MAG TPA: ABC transporter permease [Mycobacteriales bacterium]|nr:ABC transporter permease [Mycobacteriales bacterium]
MTALEAERPARRESPAPVTLALHQMRYEQITFWRNPQAAFFTFAFPILFFFIFASTFGKHHLDGRLNALEAVNYYVPSILGYGIASATFVNLAIGLSIRRERGTLKSLRGTPLPASSLIGGVIGSAFVIALIEVAIILAVGTIGYGARLQPGRVLPLIVAIVLAVPSYAGLGVLVSSLVRNAEAAPAIVNLPYVFLTFISGTYFEVHGALAKVAEVFPLRPFILAALHCFDPSVHSAWDWKHLGVIAAWGVVGGVLAVRTFRWEPAR